MGFEQLSGPQAKILRQAIMSAFVNTAALDMFIGGELNKPPVGNFAGGTTLEEQVFNMIRAAQAEGWTENLVAALQASRPLVRNLPDALRLSGWIFRPEAE